jgi:ABC-type Fe3+/spermidine/putrescine transport system ATPase subunit
MGRITLEQVTKQFGTAEVIPPLDLEIEDGEFAVFVGPSGCGKSTLLRLIAGLEDVSSGTIRIDGIDATSIPPAKRGLAMVFQSYALYPHMSVRNNIAFPLRMAGFDKAEQNRRVEQAAAVLNLTDYLDRRPGQLSGGQRQRVAIGRAIVREPIRIPLRRAAFQSRRRASRGHAARDLRTAQAAQDDDDLRDPRPGRGHDHGRQDRGAARGPYRAGRVRRSTSTGRRATSSSPASSARPR